uniref:Reverse transcriptase domain-containing protein n=1 Tax=Biomphalaria glabrata TaxID=6526 RepID=A0A2C9L4B3_BIOGL
MELDEYPSLVEVETAIEKLKRHKMPGSGGLPADVFNMDGASLTERLIDLFTLCWDICTISPELRDATIISLYKKGDKSDCSNYRGITLLSVAGKIFARRLLERLANSIEGSVLSASQCGFQAGRGTSDMILVLRQCRENAGSLTWTCTLHSST